MRAITLLLLVFVLGSSMAYAKGVPNPIAASGSPGAERCKEIAAIAEKVAANPDAVRGRIPRRLAMDAMRCAAAEKKAAEQKESDSFFKKFLNARHLTNGLRSKPHCGGAFSF